MVCMIYDILKKIFLFVRKCFVWQCFYFKICVYFLGKERQILIVIMVFMVFTILLRFSKNNISSFQGMFLLFFLILVILIYLCFFLKELRQIILNYLRKCIENMQKLLLMWSLIYSFFLLRRFGRVFGEISYLIS